jgi:hypothetical protein
MASNAFKMPVKMLAKCLQNDRENARNSKGGSNLSSVTRHGNNPVRVVTIPHIHIWMGEIL